MLGRLWEGCSLVVVVYDVTREETLAIARSWLDQLKQTAGLKTVRGVHLSFSPGELFVTLRRQIFTTTTSIRNRGCYVLS